VSAAVPPIITKMQLEAAEKYLIPFLRHESQAFEGNNRIVKTGRNIKFMREKFLF